MMCLLVGSDKNLYRELRSMGNALGDRNWAMEWRSLRAIWWVSRSASLKRETKICCLSATLATWKEKCGVKDWLWRFMGWGDFDACELMLNGLQKERERGIL